MNFAELLKARSIDPKNIKIALSYWFKKIEMNHGLNYQKEDLRVGKVSKQNPILIDL